MLTLAKPETLTDRGFMLQLPAQVHRFTDEEFFAFCQANRPLGFERDKFGNIFITMPTGSKTSNLNSELLIDFGIWNRKHKLGRLFDSSGGFRLPDTSVKSADVAWVANTRWNALTADEQEVFAPVCPDFVLELLSASDRLADAQQKMGEWMANGCRLAWLLDARTQTAYIFRADGTQIETTGFAQPLSGGDVLPGFTLDLTAFQPPAAG